MTDLDVVFQRAAPGWVPVARALRNVIGPHKCGPTIERALTAYLRSHCGMDDPLVVDLIRLRWDGQAPTQQDFVHVLRMLVRNQVADRVLPGLVASGVYESRASGEAHLGRCLQAAKLNALANRWMAQPDGNVRASPRRRSSLRDLLAEPAPLGARA